MVTAELAVGLMTAALAVIVSCWVVNLVVVQTACADVASQVARQVARSDAAAARKAEQRAPEGATVRVARGTRTVTVTVRSEQKLGKLGPVVLEGRAVADLEPGA
ncbi:TadE family type IV pilus minor pilin [Luteococcus sp. Sow4_B9]|uniref:TadE family type IV pilus minor pilin n=1 Tax=Luteococcus sp. Sow4_B9 TaxID=3438792 RepID=UPI003F96B0AD